MWILWFFSIFAGVLSLLDFVAIVAKKAILQKNDFSKNDFAKSIFCKNSVVIFLNQNLKFYKKIDCTRYFVIFTVIFRYLKSQLFSQSKIIKKDYENARFYPHKSPKKYRRGGELL